MVADAAERPRRGGADAPVEARRRVLDLSMPDMNGLAATRAMKEAMPQVEVVALTRHADDAYVQELLSAGASGYVLKQSPFDELLQAIRAAANGRALPRRRRW